MQVLYNALITRNTLQIIIKGKAKFKIFFIAFGFKFIYFHVGKYDSFHSN